MNAVEIVLEVGLRHGLKPQDFRWESPHVRRYASARGEAMARIHSELAWSYAEIGRYFGGFKASSVLRAVRRANQPPRPDANGPKPITLPKLAARVRDLRRRIEWLEQRAGFVRQQDAAFPRLIGGAK